MKVRCLEGAQTDGAQLKGNLETRLQIFHIDMTSDPAISLLGIYTKELYWDWCKDLTRKMPTIYNREKAVNSMTIEQ